MRPTRLSALVAALTLPLLPACTGGDSPAPPPDAADGADAGGEDAAEDAADPAKLVARVRALSPGAEVPRGVAVKLRRDVFSGDQVGGPAPSGTTLEITPAVEGELRVDGRDSLMFVPTRGFQPGTAYTAAVRSVATPEGPVAAPDGAWATTFETPAFSFVRAGVVKRDLQKGSLEIDLVFSAPVDADTVASKLGFSLDGSALYPARVETGPRDTVVRVTFQGRRIARDGALAVTVGAGVPYLHDAGLTAARGEASLDLRTGPPVEIEALVVKEGAQGHYLEVVCSDPAAGGERWWWDPDTYDGWWVSSRCHVGAEQAATGIHVTPAVEFTVAEGPAGYRLFGDFAQGDYQVTLDAGLMTVDGGMLAEQWDATVRVPQRTPRVTFASKGRYLPRSAWDRLAVRHLNTADGELVVRHVPERNLVFWLTGEQEAADARTSDIVLRHALDLSGPEDEEATTWLDVGSLLPDAGRGVYEVAVQAGEARDAARLLLTDLQLVAKRGAPADVEGVEGEIVVWALDTHTNAPQAGVDVRLVKASGQDLDTCRTGGDGSCRLEIADERVDDAPAVALVASRGSDLTYLKFSDLTLQSDADTTGAAWAPAADAAAYKAAAWTDRGVYRPGDTAHVAALLRGRTFAAPDAGLPVVLRLVDPRGKEVRKVVRQTDATGLVSVDLPFADFATTGRYRVDLEVADRGVGRAEFAVEEFVPERMKVTAAAEGDDHAITDPVPVTVEARWLFGGSASGSPVEATCRLQPATFEPKQNKAWHYGLAELEDRRLRALDLGVVEAEIDADGKATVTCPAPLSGGGWVGPAALSADIAVFEGESGRSTKARVSTPVHPEAFYVGVRSNVEKLASGQTARLDGVVVDHQGALTSSGPDAVTVVIERLDAEYGWWWDDEEESSSYRRLLRRSRVDEREVAVSGGKWSLAFQSPGDAEGWLISVTAGAARTELRLDGAGRRFWWSPRDREVDQTPRPGRPTPLALQVPEHIEVGETAKVTVTAPYAGRLLYTVEADRVLHWEWKDVDAGPVTLDLRVDDFHPNVYASALLLKDPHLESKQAFLPDRAHGVASVRVAPTAWTQGVKLDVPAEIEPWSTLTVGLKVDPAEGPVTATVAVVDEGILQLTRFESPDPARTIFEKRRLGIDSFETIGWSLLADPSGPSSSVGGGVDGGGGRVQMVKPVALWSGPVEVGADGKASVSFDIPGYRGQLRVMAVTSGRARMGHAQADVTVKDPLVLQTTLPRFLVAGDIAQIPVFVSNMSGKDRRVTVGLEIEDLETTRRLDRGAEGARPIADTIGEKRGQLQLADGDSGTVVFQVTANRAPGAARFRVTATADGLTSKEELELPVVPSLPEDRRTTRIALSSAGVDLDAALVSQGWMPGTDRTSVWLTTNPYGDALTHLQALIRYPYGCIEQTTSSTRPLLYAKDLLPFLDPDRVAEASVDDMVAAGIERVMSMQTPQGGFAYWPGSSHPSAWGTAYATHMLLDAKDAGFPVDGDALGEALSWLERETGGRANDDPDGTLAYAHFVLARAGRGQAARAAELLERYDGKPEKWRWRGSNQEARYLLMAAVHLSGDHRHADALKALDTSAISGARENSWSFYSDLRRRGLMLAAYQDVFGVDDRGGDLADAVAGALRKKKAGYYTTQELAWGISALGRRVQKAGGSLPDAALSAGGKAVTPAETGANGDRVWSLTGATGVADLDLSLAQAPTDGAWLVTTVQGVRAADDLPTGGRGLSLERTFRTASGETLDPSRHRLGDRVFVETTIRNTSGDRVRNIALVDRIPAGWELENPRLGGGELPEFVDRGDLWTLDHMNLRDDRLEVFGELASGESRSVVYVVRAVTAGSFQAPEVKAEAMYDPDIWAREPGREIEILGPWADFLL